MPLAKPLSICFLHDDRIGHLKQLKALEAELKQLTECSTTWLDCNAPDQAAYEAMPFELCVGAGHKTHWPLWKLARQHKAFSAVVMSPSLPKSMFDAVICPRHDGHKSGARIFLTEGPISYVQLPEPECEADAGLYEEQRHYLVLLGGPSKHFDWHEEKVSTAISTLMKKFPTKPWFILPSRRTPKSTISKMQNQLPSCTMLAIDSNFEDLLLGAQQVWVSADSSNMLYESLGSGKPTGVIELPCKNKIFKRSRLHNELERLLNARRVMRLSDVSEFSELSEPALSESETEELLEQWRQPPLNEAKRAARWLLERYQQQRHLDGQKNV